jgi:hypothetical protein
MPFPNKKRLFNLEISLRAIAAQRASDMRSRLRPAQDPVDICLCIVDHFEPQWGQPSREVAEARVEDWMVRYPRVAGKHEDADGRAPAHTFCYPWDEFDAWEFGRLVDLCRPGWGEIELHLHHQDDTDETLRVKLREALETYRRHGALSTWPDGRAAFGFVHGNWALANGRCEHGRNWCGVDNELEVLVEEGCFADFTFPAWQHLSQPRKLNSIYYARGDGSRPKPYDRGTDATVGQTTTPGLLLVPGPLVPYTETREGKVRSGIDDSDLAGSIARRYAPFRLDHWVRAGIHVQGRADRIFIKLHCHGAPEQNRDALLEDLELLFADAEARYNDGKRFRLHYVTARELFNIVKATEAAAPGSIDQHRDWLLPRPAFVGTTSGCHPERVAVS